MGKVDQGFVALWVARHLFEGRLSYIGFGGSGKQVRDLLHVADLVDLIELQLLAPEHWDGAVVNVGGGRACSLSLLETTALCRELSGREIDVGAAGGERPGDVPVYLSDCTRLFSLTDWRPRRGASAVLRDIADWIRTHRDDVRMALS